MEGNSSFAPHSNRDSSEGLTAPKRQINKKFIQNAALKFRRQLITTNRDPSNLRNKQPDQGLIFNENQRLPSNNATPRLTDVPALHPYLQHNPVYHQHVNRLQNLQLPQHTEVSPAPLASVRNLTMKTPNKQQKSQGKQITPKNVQQMIVNGKQDGQKFNFPVAGKDKGLLNQTLYSNDGGNAYQLNQTINHGVQNQGSFNSSGNQNQLSSGYNRHSRLKGQVQQNTQVFSNTQIGNQSPISARNSVRNQINLKNKAQVSRAKGYNQADFENQYNKGIVITPKHNNMVNITHTAWNPQVLSNQTIDPSQMNSSRRNPQFPHQQVMALSSHRGSNNEKGRFKNTVLQISNDINLVNLQNQSVLTPGKRVESTKQSQQQHQFPPVNQQLDMTDSTLIQNILKSRENTHRRNNNKTTQEGSNHQSQVNKTVDLVVQTTRNQESSTTNASKTQNRALSSFNNTKEIFTSTGQNSISSRGAKKEEQLKNRSFPMSGEDALKLYGSYLSPYEKQELKSFEMVYYMSFNKKKSSGHNTSYSHAQENENDSDSNQGSNYGYDNDQGDYLFESSDHINYRYEIMKRLGKGAFGVVLQCFDHKTKEKIALKILKNKKKLHKQGKIEIKILELLRDNDPEDSKNIVTVKDSFTFRKHICICFEILSINLYQFIKNNEFQGFSSALTKRFTMQILMSLAYLHKFTIVHCDLKPENVLLKYPNKSQVKLIDFGSSCFEKERYYTYIQSRFYRAPEIMLGIPYTTAIDMWSLGCIVYECLVGIPIFAGENERDQMGSIMEVIGLPPRSLIAKATRRKVFFDDDYEPIIKANSRGKVRRPGSKPLSNHARFNDPDLIEFLTGCFEWKPEKRLKPEEALQMPWIQKAITESRQKREKMKQGQQQQEVSQTGAIPPVVKLVPQRQPQKKNNSSLQTLDEEYQQ